MVGIGPGDLKHVTPMALDAIRSSDVVVGYKTYIELIEDVLEGKTVISTGMTKEIERCQKAVSQAQKGLTVAVVSSGDPGVYGMAGLVIELVEKNNLLGLLEIEIIPGVTSATSAAANLGAPLMHDFAVISLSDLLTSWEVISRRIDLSAQADFIIILYNPASNKRNWQLRAAVEIMLRYKNPHTPVGIVRNSERPGETVCITTLDLLADRQLDMLTTVIVGNKNTRHIGNYLVTARGYNI